MTCQKVSNSWTSKQCQWKAITKAVTALQNPAYLCLTLLWWLIYYLYIHRVPHGTFYRMYASATSHVVRDVQYMQCSWVPAFTSTSSAFDTRFTTVTQTMFKAAISQIILISVIHVVRMSQDAHGDPLRTDCRSLAYSCSFSFSCSFSCSFRVKLA